MSDNSPATDERMREIMAAYQRGAYWWCENQDADYLDKAAYDYADQITSASRIRAETAKNSGEVVACHCTLIEQDESCPIGYPSLLCDDCDGKGHVSNEPPLCWIYEDELPESLTTEAYNALFPYSKLVGVRLFPVFGPANSRAEAIGVKPLEWENLGGGVYKAPSPLFGSIRIEPRGSEYCVTWSVPGMCDTFTKGFFGTPDDAKAAAQADYERRIRSALLQQEGE